MTPDDLLSAYADAQGPDADAQARLMGRLAALGEPATVVPPKRARVGPWLFGAAVLAAAVALVWVVSPNRAQQVEDDRQSMAPNAATPSPVEGDATTRRPDAAPAQRTTPAVTPSLPQVPVETLDPPAPETSPAERAPTTRRAPSPRRKPAAPQTPAQVEPTDTLAAEATLLARVRGSLSRGDAAAALALLKTYDDTYETPRLAEEARALRTMARCTRDGPDEAAARAFTQRHRGSMFRAQVERACSPRSGQEKKSDGG
ncbi:MAG: hypothetical protein AAGA54_23255 [Myxococcota bacterium]